MQFNFEVRPTNSDHYMCSKSPSSVIVQVPVSPLEKQDSQYALFHLSFTCPVLFSGKGVILTFCLWHEYCAMHKA
ncbi:hypothetical protein JCGZ_24985 [Jatropha curcas]|uniref:Uncharacterized protein n=1 Tax=Jatropha curcas TaxID=180498 RepID=A0A067KXN8_JATCU|nr:hypothetical protein JCGZ_24985 [Jatropha curcas]